MKGIVKALTDYGYQQRVLQDILSILYYPGNEIMKSDDPVASDIVEEIRDLQSERGEALAMVRKLRLSMAAHPDYVSRENQEFVDYVNIADELIDKLTKK